MIPVTRKELEHFRKQLLNQKTLLLAGITKKMGSSPKTGDPEGGDVCDIASSDRERDLKLRLSERDREKLKQIDEAIERIEDGYFGECEACGSKIPMERLKVMPFTTVCVPCKSKQEKHRKLFHDANEFAFSRGGETQDFTKEEEE